MATFKDLEDSLKTYMIQELHLPVYHCWCLMLEDHFFGKNDEKIKCNCTNL